MRLNLLIIIFLFLLTITASAEDQTGAAVDFRATEIRVLTDGVDANLVFQQKKHGSFIADFETDRLDGQTTLSPSLGYQVFLDYKRLHPYAYGGLGSTTTIGQGTMPSGAVGQGLDFRISKKCSLRFEHEFDWAKQSSGQWTNRYTAIVVWRIK